MSRINTKIIEDYIKLQESLPDIMKAYNLKVTAVLSEAKINKSSFYSKKEKKTLTPDELRRIANVINK